MNFEEVEMVINFVFFLFILKRKFDFSVENNVYKKRGLWKGWFFCNLMLLLELDVFGVGMRNCVFFRVRGKIVFLMIGRDGFLIENGYWLFLEEFSGCGREWKVGEKFNVKVLIVFIVDGSFDVCLNFILNIFLKMGKKWG